MWHELCSSALHLNHPISDAEQSKKKREARPEFVQVRGPDFPTGGIIIDSREASSRPIARAAAVFASRARWQKEEGNRGYLGDRRHRNSLSGAEIALIEKIAELLLAKKLPLLDDIRDESAEDIRIVLEPKNRTVDPELLMESLFKLTELESRVSLNMNVLSHGKVPNVLSLGSVLREWLDHRKEVLVRRSQFRLAEIESAWKSLAAS
jgi:topoisomerase-4 subunit A